MANGQNEMVVNLRIAGPECLTQFLEEHIEACRAVRRLQAENAQLKATMRRMQMVPVTERAAA